MIPKRDLQNFALKVKTSKFTGKTSQQNSSVSTPYYLKKMDAIGLKKRPTIGIRKKLTSMKKKDKKIHSSPRKVEAEPDIYDFGQSVF
tara:strand:- start:496 stop:759 length:264 start_codon:yes stop_codon:yes gene_type:complete